MASDTNENTSSVPEMLKKASAFQSIIMEIPVKAPDSLVLCDNEDDRTETVNSVPELNENSVVNSYFTSHQPVTSTAPNCSEDRAQAHGDTVKVSPAATSITQKSKFI